MQSRKTGQYLHALYLLFKLTKYAVAVLFFLRATTEFRSIGSEVAGAAKRCGSRGPKWRSSLRDQDPGPRVLIVAASSILGIVRFTAEDGVHFR